MLIAALLVRLFGDTGPATESSPNTVVLSFMHTAIDQSITRAYQYFAFQITVDNVMYKYVAKLHIVDAVATRMIEFLPFIVSVPKLF